MKLQDIRIRDPFIVPHKPDGQYYLFGTTDTNAWSGIACGFDYYVSKNLIEWEGPFQAFRPKRDFWADTQFWAPEVHEYNGSYYLFATFNASDGSHKRGTQILKADKITGPYQPITPYPVTPHQDECLDGTLFVDDRGKPWMIYCHEWCQIVDGAMCTIPLSDDLKTSIGQPQVLFYASQAKWTKPINDQGSYVTDGPYVYTTKNNKLLLLWSSYSETGYTIGVSVSLSGHINGPYHHVEEPLYSCDGGHGMVLHDFSGRLFLSIHQPNDTPNERTLLIELHESNDMLFAKSPPAE